MSKPRKGKRERALLREQHQIFRAVRDDVIRSNLNSPKPVPVKYATLGRLDKYGTRARVSQLIIRNDPMKQRKAAEKKYGLPDSALYDYSKY